MRTTFSNAQLTGPAMGIIPGKPDESRANFAALLADDDEGLARRTRLHHVLKVNRTEFQANDLEIGFWYEHGAVIPDGTSAPARDPLGHHYVPTTRPGHRLPHAWIGRKAHIVSTLDLVPPDRFVLLVGQPGTPWIAAAAEAGAALGVPIDAVSVGDRGEVIDRDHAWRRQREISDTGAILVRPDQHVAWRCAELPASPAGALQDALASVLGR
jgi:2,4-dichlorophenol 6-monooxygenase